MAAVTARQSKRTPVATVTEETEQSIETVSTADKGEEVEEVKEKEEEAKPKLTRVRRVTSSFILPKEDSLAKLVLGVVGHETPVEFEVDFSKMTEDFLHQAALSGMLGRLGIAYSGLTETDKILEAIQGELKNFTENKFISRSTGERKLNAPDIVIAWMMATNKDPEDKELLEKYVSSWNSRDKEGKEVIENNLKVIQQYEALLAARRLARKQKNATKDDSVLELEV